MKLYMLRTVPLSIIRTFSLYTQQWYMLYRFADSCEQDQDGTSWSWLHAVCKPVWRISLLCVQWKIPDDRQRNCPEHVEFHSKKKIWEISASSWFYYKKLNTMHGHMNIKKDYFPFMNIYLLLRAIHLLYFITVSEDTICYITVL
jgi:hypothetical protein